ncbi:hypothetical protein G9A89_003814 [Geosiphon pyriformis]|nr:hypothetical protein G9A89_003814 [Geosiphon pyriformis]
MNIGIRVDGMLSSTMAKLQAIALFLKCVPSSCMMIVHADSQAAIDVCISEMSLSVPDFCFFFKVKGHSGIVNNIRANAAAGDAVFSCLSLPVGVQECFLVAENTPISGNTCHFKTGPGCDVIFGVLIETVDWDATVRMWHPNSHMLAGFTNRRSSSLCTYLMKTVHQQLPVAVRKRLYDKLYPGVLCLLCCKMELSDHVFTCSHNVEVYKEVLVIVCSDWLFVIGSYGSSSSAVLQSLGQCFLDVSLYLVLCKGFVLREWCEEAVGILNGKKEAVSTVVGFVGHLVELYCSKA